MTDEGPRADPSTPFGDWPASPPPPAPADPTADPSPSPPSPAPSPHTASTEAAGAPSPTPELWSTSPAMPPVPPAPQVPPSSPPAPPTFGPYAAPVGDDTPVVARIGELAVTSTTVHTPAGPIPLAGSTWQVTDHWLTEQKTATWAVAVAILGFCLVGPFSLLFLLVKETTYRGTVQVVLSNGQRQYVARIPVADQVTVQQLHQQVNYVRSLAAL